MVFGLGIFIASVLTLLTPVVARTSKILFISLRVTEGIAQVRHLGRVYTNTFSYRIHRNCKLFFGFSPCIYTKTIKNDDHFH